MGISTTYQPGGMTTETSFAGGGGGFGGGGGGGLDAELIRMYRDRARESAADRGRQRAMDRQRFDWEKQAHVMAGATGLQGPDPDFALKQKEKAARMMSLDASMNTPQRELQDSRPGVVGGYGGPDVSRMNAISRGLYAPKQSENQGFVGSAPGAERVDIDQFGGSRLIDPMVKEMARQQLQQRGQR